MNTTIMKTIIYFYFSKSAFENKNKVFNT